MRSLSLFSFILAFNSAFSQMISEAFYDHNWKPCTLDIASFYTTIEKTDSGYLRRDYFIAAPRSLQMQALYKDEACKVQDGPYLYFYSDGNLKMSGRKYGSAYEGPCVSYWRNGMIMDSAYYHSGQLVGADMGWHQNGVMHDSAIAVNDTLTISYTWHMDGSPASGGYYAFGKKHGTWKYFHPNGQLAAEAVYDHGKQLNKKYFTEDGTLLPDTISSKYNRDAQFRRGKEDWLNFIYKNIYWPRGYKLENTDQVTVVVSFTITEEGKVEDVAMDIPFYHEFDKIALSAVKGSPAWKPALKENLKVKDYFQQPITFTQE